MWSVLNELHIIKLLIFIFIHCSASLTLVWPKGADDSAWKESCIYFIFIFLCSQFLFAKDV